MWPDRSTASSDVAASMTYCGRRRASASALQTYSPTVASASICTPERPTNTASTIRRPPPSSGSSETPPDRQRQRHDQHRRAEIRAPAERRIGKRRHRIDDEPDLSRQGPSGRARCARLLVVFDVLLAESHPGELVEHAGRPFRKRAERVDDPAIRQEEVRASRRHLAQARRSCGRPSSRSRRSRHATGRPAAIGARPRRPARRGSTVRAWRRWSRADPEGRRPS